MSRATEDTEGAPSDLTDQTVTPAEDFDLDLIMEENSELRIHTPPPHIAARFYRPSATRRKSSAASSRRNSVSSAHSQLSHASSRKAGSQSSYIAHNLRRASIIEDRKARLADRAAHAEKVRLRAALAKAAPRSSINSEERALAAQHAREKNLAEIVASCAEEVKRAKAIAESMREKREAEGKRLRKEREERLAEAERRREEFRNKGNFSKRGRSMSHPRKSVSPALETVKEALSEVTAASRIQRRWRIHARWKALKEFASLGLTVDGVRERSFDEVADLLAQQKVLVSTAHILRICGLKEGESGSVNEMTAVRTFLSAFFILGHPTQVLSGRGDNGEKEQDLVAKARDLLIAFETVLSRLNAGNNYNPPGAQLTALSENYAAFYNAFIAWKARDSTTLIDMMVLQFVELDAIWQTVSTSTEEAVTDSYRDGIRENQLKLMVRIKRLAGPVQGKRLITNAIKEARKSKAAKRPTGDSRPRATESSSSEAPTLAELSASEQSVTSKLQILTPPATPRRQQNTGADLLRSASTVLPENRIVAHEIAINREYRIEEEAIVGRDSMTHAIFEGMRQAIAAGNSAEWVLAMAENIRGKLQNLLKEGNSMHKLIGEALDDQLIANELERGIFSYEKFFSFMAMILPKLCAPFRDDEMKDIVENKMQRGDVVSRLEALMHGIDLMQLDYANFMLQQAAPELIKHVTAYETARFSEIMERTSNDLSETKTAWTVASNKVFTEAARRDPENVNLARNRPTPEKMYAQMLVDVFTSLDATIGIPETLQLDTKRIVRIRADILRIVTTGAIILQCKNLLKRDVRSQWKTEASRVFSVLESSKSPEQAIQGIQVALESSRSMPAATKNHIKELVSRVVSAAAAISISPPSADAPTTSTTTELRDPVMRLLMTRIRGHLLGRLAANTENERLRSASTASEGLATLGLPEFVQKVGGIVEEVGKVGALDRAAHGLWYEIVAREVEATSSESE